MSVVPRQSDPGGEPALAELLQRHRPQVERLVRREAGVVLLRFEDVEDLLQGAYCGALRAADAFQFRSEPEFASWLFTVIRRHLGDRRDYWFAQKRNRGRLLRLTWGAVKEGTAAPFGDIAMSGTGPRTFAERREHLTLVTKAMALLLPRDRDLVCWSAED